MAEKRISRPNRQVTLLPALLALLLALSFTYFLWSSERKAANEKAEKLFLEEVNQITHLAGQRLNLYVSLLQGAQSFFAASQNVKNYEWKVYVDHFNLVNHYPGIRALRFIQRISDKEKKEFTSNIQRQEVYSALNYPDFRIHPEVSSEEHFIVKYVEPLAGNQWMFGYDLASEEPTRSALYEARDRNHVSATGIINIQQGRAKSAKGFVIALPVFRVGTLVESVEQRRKNLMGFVDMVLKTDELFADLLVHNADQPARVQFEIFDGEKPDDKHLIFRSAPLGEEMPVILETPRFLTTSVLEVAGRKWTLYFTSKPGFRLSSIEENFSWFILYTGLAISLLLFGIFYSLSLSRIRAEEIAEKMTEGMKKALQVKMEFTSTVSHELRTPLAAIKESVSMVQDGTMGKISSEQKDILTTALSNVDRLSRLINAVLDYQKLESKPIQFQKVWAEINAFVEETVKPFRVLARKKDLDIRCQLDHSNPHLWMDRDRVTQVLVNLLDNAVKFSDHGVIEVQTKKDGSGVRISVKDQGPGIPPEDVEKLFQNFSQLPHRGSRKTGGTGLGLAISKKIIEAHGGKIGVLSSPSGGAEFYFELPVEKMEVLTRA